MVDTRGWWEGGTGSHCLMGAVSLLQDEQALEMDGGDGYTT